MGLLTDTEQKRLLSELYSTTTRTKVEAVLRKYRLDQIPEEIKREIEALRQENKQRHKIDGWKFLRGLAAKVVGDIDNLSK